MADAIEIGGFAAITTGAYLVASLGVALIVAGVLAVLFAIAMER